MRVAQGRLLCSRGVGGLHATPARLVPTCRRRFLTHICHTAASDEKRKSQPQYLSDLIAFESDSEDDVSAVPSSHSASDNGSSGSSSSLASSLGLADSASDPTQRAQDIISRATEVLAAARAALGTSETSAAAAGGAAVGQNGSSTAPTQAAAGLVGSSSKSSSNKRVSAGQQQLHSSNGATAVKQPTSSAAAPPSPAAVAGKDSSSDPSAAGDSSSSSGGEQLTRRWSQLSEGQDLTRHVLQNALDQMQRSGAPIAAPKDDPPSSSSSGGSSRGGPRGGPGSSLASSSRGGTAAPSSSKTSSPAAAAAAAAAGSSRVSRSPVDRDLRKGGVPGDGHTPAPSWAQSLLGPDDFSSSTNNFAQRYQFPSDSLIPQLQPQPAAAAAAAPGALAFADDLDYPPIKLPPAALSLVSQSALDAEKARNAVLPPLQSVLQLTTAFRPPDRTGAAPAAAAEDAAAAAAAPVGRSLADGSGRLADGTWWEKKSGVEYGKNGYWKRWQLLKGGSEDGTVEWSETWWEASDYTGLKELGAQKNGRSADGSAWRESWTERLMYASNDLDCVVERNAHKWAVDEHGDEWEEKWGEHYHASGKVAKYADKWGKQGPNVWHERWGEDYDSSAAGSSDACVKWTDKWAERLLPGGAREQWGDKWHEAFAGGRGEKNGEVWSVGAGGERYQRWWGEHHIGDGRVRRFGHSTTGEQWDDTLHMSTYYNPVPHFGFKHALQHSPQLRNVPLQPKHIDEKNPFGPGLDKL